MLIFILVLIGLSAGSFINAMVWRLHEQSKKSASKQDLSIISGRSMCPNCKHQLSAADLIPVLSWLSLKRKCRYCHQPISWQYPAVELLTAIAFVFSYIYWPESFNYSEIVLFGLWLIFLVGLLSLAIYDLKWFLLPNIIIYPLLGLAFIQVIFLSLSSLQSFEVIKEALLGLMVGGGIFYGLFQLSHGKWIGGGDVKLGALLGILVGGPLASFLLLFMASLIGSFAALPLLLTGRAKRGTRLPFGPFLILAAIIVRLFGAAIIDWYKNRLLL